VDGGFLPVEVAQAKPNDVARTEAQACEQKENRTVPPANRRGRVTRSNDPLDFIGLQISWQGRKTPMRENGDRSIQPDGAPAVGNQETQKHPDCRGAPFRHTPSALLTSLQDELSQTLRIKLGRVLSQTLQQSAKVKAVVAKGGIAGPALLLHPATECNQ
jgi:hypothetical protein